MPYHRLQMILIRFLGFVNQLLKFRICGINFGIYVQKFVLIPHQLTIYKMQGQLSDERTKSSGFCHLCIFPLHRLAQSFVRVIPQDIIHIFRQLPVGKIHLLKHSNVSYQEKHIYFFLFFDFSDKFLHLIFDSAKAHSFTEDRILPHRNIRIIDTDKANFNTFDLFDPVRRKEGFSISFMKHILGDDRGIVPGHNIHHPVFTIDHFPVPGNDHIIAHIAYELRENTPFRKCGIPAPLDKVSTIYNDGAPGILFPLFLKKGFYIGQPASFLKNDLLVFPEQFGVGIKLPMNIGRLQHGDAQGISCIFFHF